MNANDNFDKYYAEKIWEMIPAIHRRQDAELAEALTPNACFQTSSPAGPLRELVELIAEQAAEIRRNTDRLWDDQFIDFCRSEAIPYIADLLGTRLPSVLNERARRIDTAKTVYYRRRKGTLRILEELISDITGWEGTVVEAFRRLGRTPHRLDSANPYRRGSTQPGGFADLRKPGNADNTGTAFDGYYYTPDVRRGKGRRGMYNIPKLLFFLYRQHAARLESVTPYQLTDGTYTFDPAGRSVPLFQPRNRKQVPFSIYHGSHGEIDWSAWKPASENELPYPLTARRAAEQIAAGNMHNLFTLSEEETVIDPDTVAAGLIDYKNSIPAGKNILIDPESGQFAVASGPVPSSIGYNIGISAEIGAGPFHRRTLGKQDIIRTATTRWKPGPNGSFVMETPSKKGALYRQDFVSDGVTLIEDDATYFPVADKTSIRNLTVCAGDYRCPFLLLKDASSTNIGTNWVLNTGENKNSFLTLEGLRIGTTADEAVILRGNYECVTIRNCTFDPDGSRPDGTSIPATPLVVEGYVEKLILDKSIACRIIENNNGHIRQLIVRDSIMQCNSAKTLHLLNGAMTIENSTIMGTVTAKKLFASNSIFSEKIYLQDKQNSAFRYCIVRRDISLAIPYETVQIEPGFGLFSSETFGEPSYASLRRDLPESILCAGENNLEPGVFNHLHTQEKLRELRKKAAEYAPFGTIAEMISET